MSHNEQAKQLLAKEKQDMDRLIEIDRCLRTLSDQFCRVAQVEDADVTIRFFEAKEELHIILSEMAGEEGDLLEACKMALSCMTPEDCDITAKKLRAAIARAEGKEP